MSLPYPTTKKTSFQIDRNLILSKFTGILNVSIIYNPKIMNYKKKILKNGLRIVAVPIKNAPSVTVMSLIETGSKYENKQNNGISHFLEHMFFKCTENRPKAIDISREFDSLGAEYNAFTSQEVTGYWATAHKKHADKVLDIISD